MTVSDFFIDLPDTGNRFFNEHEVYYGSAGASIDLYRRDWQGNQALVAHIEFIDDAKAEVMNIPGDEDDAESHRRPLQLQLHGRRLQQLLTLFATPGWKRIFVNEETDAWWIRVYSGFGAGTADG